MSWICPRCGSDNDDSARRCMDCGFNVICPEPFCHSDSVKCTYAGAGKGPRGEKLGRLWVCQDCGCQFSISGVVKKRGNPPKADFKLRGVDRGFADLEGYPEGEIEDPGWKCRLCGTENGVDSLVCKKCHRTKEESLREENLEDKSVRELQVLYSNIDSLLRASENYAKHSPEYRKIYEKRVGLLKKAKSLCVKSFTDLHKNSLYDAQKHHGDAYALYMKARDMTHDADGYHKVRSEALGSKDLYYPSEGEEIEKFNGRIERNRGFVDGYSGKIEKLIEKRNKAIEDLNKAEMGDDPEIESKRKEFQRNSKKIDEEISRYEKSLENIEAEVKKDEDERESLEGKAYRKKDVARGIEDLINAGHTAGTALLKIARKHEMKGEDKENFIKEFGEFAVSHEKHRGTIGHPKWGSVPLVAGLKAMGRSHNTKSIQGLQKEIEKLEKRRDYLKNKQEDGSLTGLEEAELNETHEEILECEQKLSIFEEHPELIKRAKHRMEGFGDKVSRGNQALRDFKNNAGGKIVNGYSALKAKTSGALSLFFAMIIFVAMLVLTQTAGDAYFPINAWQVVTFLVLTILIALIKISLSEDKSAEQEAKEITGLIILAGTIIAIIIGIKLGNGFSWGSLIFCIICGLYVFFDFVTDSVIVSFMLFLGMCFLVYFTMTGWMDMVGVQAEKLAIETGFDEAIETSIHSISDGASDVWLMLSDPNAWFQKKQTEKDMAKAEGQTKKALEITGATMWPGTVNMGETANLVVEVENFGDKEAKSAEVYVRVDENDQGHISVRGYNEGKDKASKYLGNVLKDATARHAFTIIAPPDCVGTFKLTCGVSYEYDVVATGDIAVISKERFEELRRQGKMRPIRHVTTSGGGPVSVNVQTDKDEPIAVLLADEVGDGAGSATEVQVHITVHNHGAGSGTLRLTNMVVKMPKGFEIHPGATGEDDAERDCGLVKFKAEESEVDDDYEYYHVKAFGGDECGVYIGDAGAAGSGGSGGEELGGDAVPEEGGEAGEEESEDEIDSCNLLEDRKMFMCDMTYTPPHGAKLSFPKHLPFMVDIDYDYSYEKKTSFSVKAGFLKKDEKPKKCKDGGNSSSGGGSTSSGGGSGDSGDSGASADVCWVADNGKPTGYGANYAQYKLEGEGPDGLKVESYKSAGMCRYTKDIECEGWSLRVTSLPKLRSCKETIVIKYEDGRTCEVEIEIPVRSDEDAIW